MLIEMEQLKTVDLHKTEEQLKLSALQTEISCDSVVIGIYGLQGLLATDPWGDSYMRCSRRVPSVHPVPG